MKLDLYVSLAPRRELSGKTQDALTSIRDAEKIDSDNPEIGFWEAWIYSHSHQWPEAIRRYEAMTKKYETHKEIVRQSLFSLSNCYVQQGASPRVRTSKKSWSSGRTIGR